MHSGENVYMKNLIQMNEVNNGNRIYIGAQLFLEITQGYPPIAYLYVNQELIKKTNAADKTFSLKLLKEYFRLQLLAGLVGAWIWFTDGHFLPYTGKSKVHFSYSTQRRMPMPGQTNMVSCDSDGCIVDFEIQEGKGGLRSKILSLAEKWSGSGSGPDPGSGKRPCMDKYG